MRTVPVLTAAQAAELIPDGAVVSVSSSSALGCPDAVLDAIGRRFTRSGSPSGLTTVHPIAAGDMYGVPGIDHLARPGLLSRIIAGSYPSGPSSAEPPRIWQLIESGGMDFSLTAIANPQREKFAAFAWYDANRYYLLVRRDAHVASVEDFRRDATLRVGLIRSFRYGPAANAFVDALEADQRVSWSLGSYLTAFSSAVLSGA